MKMIGEKVGIPIYMESYDESGAIFIGILVDGELATFNRFDVVDDKYTNYHSQIDLRYFGKIKEIFKKAHGSRVDGISLSDDMEKEIKNEFDRIWKIQEKKIEKEKIKQEEENKYIENEKCFMFSDEAGSRYMDGTYYMPGYICKKKNEKTKELYEKYEALREETDFRSGEYFFPAKYFGKIKEPKTIEEIDKILSETKEYKEYLAEQKKKQEKQKIKNKYKLEDGKIFYEGKEIGRYGETEAFDNSFGENPYDETNWIPGHPYYEVIQEYFEKFKKEYTNMWVSELKEDERK